MIGDSLFFFAEIPLPEFRIVRPVKSRRHDQTASLSWCLWLDLANKCSPWLVRISPRLVSQSSPGLDGRQGMCMNKQVSLHVASLDYWTKRVYIPPYSKPRHTVIWNSPWVVSLNWFSEYYSMSLFHVTMCLGSPEVCYSRTDFHPLM